MSARSIPRLNRGLCLAVGAAVVMTAVAPSYGVWHYIMLCIERFNGTIRYMVGWTEKDCDYWTTLPPIRDCDNIFTALLARGLDPGNPPRIGDGYAFAFDRAVPFGDTIPGTSEVAETRLAWGYWPRPDIFEGGESFSTVIFAIRDNSAFNAPNQYAPIPVNLTGLSPLADSIGVSAFLGGEPITGPLDDLPSGDFATGDITIVWYSYHSDNPSVVLQRVLMPIEVSSLVFQNAAAVPPACVGDADRSGAVSFGDVTSVLANFGAAYPVGVPTPGDANGDRIVNFGDITTVLANFGAICG